MEGEEGEGSLRALACRECLKQESEVILVKKNDDHQ